MSTDNNSNNNSNNSNNSNNNNNNTTPNQNNSANNNNNAVPNNNSNHHNQMSQILALSTKKDIVAFANENKYKLKKKSSKESMKKELFELMFPEYTIESKCVEIVLQPHSIVNDNIVYVGNDGFLYDADGNIWRK